MLALSSFLILVLVRHMDAIVIVDMSIEAIAMMIVAVAIGCFSLLVLLWFWKVVGLTISWPLQIVCAVENLYFLILADLKWRGVRRAVLHVRVLEVRPRWARVLVMDIVLLGVRVLFVARNHGLLRCGTSARLLSILCCVS